MAAYSKKAILEFLAQGDAATTTSEKGKALEDLICYLFEKIPGLCLTERNVKNAYESEEIDVAFFNDQHVAGLNFLSQILIVECKNWDTPVGSSQVGWLAWKVRRRSLECGILVAANGITGDAKDRKDAHDIVTAALADGIRLLVVTRQEIESLKTSRDLVMLLKRKMLQLHLI
jgi:Restriction endonuclease